MKKLLLLSTLSLMLGACFKDKPTTEFSKVAGSWKIEEVVIDDYDSLGQSTSQVTFTDRGYILLSYNEGSLAENSFAYSFKGDLVEFTNSSNIAYILTLSNRWDVSVNASHINFGSVDPNTNYSTQLVALSIPKLTSKEMHWTLIERNTNGSIARKELFKLKRAN